MIVNGKYLKQDVTGVQRVAIEMNSRLGFPVVTNPFDGLMGHLYEQLILPFKAPGVLISFCNMGPVLKREHIVYIHDVAVLEHPEWFSRGFYWAYRVLLPLLAKRCKAIVTVSEYSKSKIVDLLNVSPDKVHVIENGVSDRFSKGGDDDVCDKYNLSSKKYILSVSSLDPRKNLNAVVEAWQTCKLRQEGYKLVLVGGANKVFSAHNIASDRTIIMTGRVSEGDLVALYHHAAGFVYMSLYEGFGLPVIEAMKARIPVLCSNTTALAEISAGYCLSCQPEDSLKISENIDKLVAVDIDTVEKAKKYADKFSWDSSVLKLQKLLREVV